MAENSLIPNTFQHPNAYIDWLSYYLTPEEEKVLNKAIREIIGWHNKIENRRARIALSVFIDGKFINGKQVAMGCGLGRDAVRGALNRLHEFNILVKVGDPTNEGQEYELNLDYESLRWDAIKLRRKVWDEANQNRMAPARKALKESRQGGTVGQYAEGVLSDSKKETKVFLETQVPAPKAAREQTPLDEPEYVDCDEDGFPVKEKERQKWQIPDTEEQKEFLAVCGAKWFEPKQKRKVKALLAAFRAGDIAGDNVYLKCLEYLESRTELVDVPPCIPRDWYEFKKPQAIEHHWNRWGFIEALLNRDALVEHCRLKQRELDRNPSKRYTLIEDEPIDEEPAVGGTLDMQAIRREFIEEQRKKGVVVNL